MTYDVINVSIESFCIFICAILAFYQLAARHKAKNHNWLTAMIVGNIIMLAGDITDRVLAGNMSPWVFYLEVIVSVIIYYIAAGLLLFSTFGWVYSYIKNRDNISAVWMRVATILTGLQVIAAFLQQPLKMNYIDESHHYVFGSFYIVGFVLPYAVYIMAVIILIKYFRVFEKRERYYLTIFLTIPVIAQVLQIVQTRFLLFNAAVTLGLIILVLFVQSQREYEMERQLNVAAQDEKASLEQVRKRQEGLSRQLIDTLCGAVEAKDLYTRGHSLRVAQYAREIMYRLGGTEAEQQEVYYIGILHDIGKISVRDEIINKNGRLTDDEYEQIKLHTIAGYQILRGVDMIPDLAVGARWHHERYDGKGYPNGLSGENIPLIARIISVADAYDAMTSNRSYHTIMPQSVAREQIEKGMGTQFDPKIAQIMLDMIDEDMQYEMKQVNYSRLTNVLFIDDDLFAHTFVEHALSDENYVLSYATSGEEGIEMLKKNKYDVCLLDMEMPGMNGFEVLEWIQKNVRKMKVIFLTGDKDIATIKKSSELGALDYLTKPINVSILKESIKSVVTH